MAKAQGTGVVLEYETFGDPADEAVLMINGLGSQMTRWPEAFCEKLVAKGYRAIRLDNRDTGLSTWPQEKYALSDMARDAVAVLDAAGVDTAHVAGVSMGGMIVQRLALDHPERVLSMTSIMSTTGEASTMAPHPTAGAVLTAPAPDPAADYEAYLAHGIKNARIIGSPAHPWTDDEIRGRVIAEHARAFNPAGVARQMSAVRADGDRTEALKALTLPVVVLHGADDPLLPKVGGEATAAAIPGAELRIIPGMGHDVPPGLYDTIIDAILAAATRAKTTA